MQSIGDKTIAELLNAESLLGVTTRLKTQQKSTNSKNATEKVTKSHTDESDLGKYFNNSSISFSKCPTGNAQKASFNHVEKEDSDDENSHVESPVLTQRSQKLRKRKIVNTKNNVITNSVEETSSKNIKPVQEAQLSIPNVINNTSSYNNALKHKDNITNESNVSSELYYGRNERSANKSSTIELSSIITTQNRVKLAHWGLPLTILRKYESRGVKSMFPWQVECLKNPKIIESSKNLVYSAPTSAGKTLVSEILVIKTVLERRKKVIFVLPFVSVVREKMYYFQDLLSDAGVRVEGFMGGVQPPGGFHATDIAIATIEKANSLINQLMEEGLLESLGAVVIDELHLLGDSHRGYLLELLLTKLKYMSLKEEQVNIQLIGMSATLPNLNVLSKWLDAALYKTDFRPVPLDELCKIGSTIYDVKLNSRRDLNPFPGLPSDPDNVLQLALETILDGHSVLIFCPTKSWCENLAHQISSAFFQLGREDTPVGRALREQLNKEAIMETLEQLKRTPMGLDKVLKNTVSFGVAFHHAGLTMDERDVVEGAFRAGALRALTATSTLSSGVNLPARRVIIRTPIFHGKAIDTLTYKQMIGRAGRMGKDSAGESILVCKATEKKTAFNILNSDLQPIESCLEGSSPLIRAIIEAVASEVAYTPQDIALYMKCTLLSSTNESSQVEESTNVAVDFLVKNELLLYQESETGVRRWVATPLGKACLAASVPPEDGLFLFEELQKARQCFVLDTELHVIYLVTPFNSASLMGQVDWYIYLDIWKCISESERRVGQLVGVKESFLVSAMRGAPKPGKTLDIHKRFYTALALHDLVREVPLHTVCNKYACCRGVIQGLQQTAATFAGMVTQFCKKLGWNCIELLVSQFQARLQFGVCRELLDLLRLPMLNGLRARSLYKEGITTVAELAVADEFDVERALYKAVPFESEKEQFGEDEYETAKRNKIRTVFVTGKDGLTPKEAAVMLVMEARNLVKNELGLDDLQWDKKDKESRTGRTVEATSLRIDTVMSNTDSHMKSNNTKVNSCSVPEEKTFENVKVVEERVETNKDEVEVDDDDVFVVSHVELSDKITKNVTHTNSFQPRISSNKQSFPASPILFNDSFDVDSQECNILEQNVLDLDSAMFDDTRFSEKKQLSMPIVDDAKTTTEPEPNKLRVLASIDLENINKSLVWDEDTWNNTKTSLNDVRKSQRLVESTKNEERCKENIQGKVTKNPSLTKVRRSREATPVKAYLEKLRRDSKNIYSSPNGVNTSPIASVITYEHTRKLSTGSNRSDDDVIIASQKIDNCVSVKKTRIRMKLESIRSRTQRTPNSTETPHSKLKDSRTKPSTTIRTKASPVFGAKRPIESNDDKNPREILCGECSAQNVVYNTDEEDVIPIKKINKLPNTKKISPEKQLRKSYNKRTIPKTISIEHISSDKTKFNDFKREIDRRTEISLALACEISLSDTVTIGTKIIGAGAYQDVRKRVKKIESGVYNGRKLCGVAMSWGERIYYLSFENVQEPGKVPIKERMTLLANILSSGKLNIRCYGAKEIYKTLYKCCGLAASTKFLDPLTSQWLLNSEVFDESFQNLVTQHFPEGLVFLGRLGPLTGNFGPGLNVKSIMTAELRACTEALLTWYLLESLSYKLESLNPRLLKTFTDVEMAAIGLLSRMELTGLGVNLAALQELSEVIQQQLSTLQEKAYDLAGKKFNFSSTKSVAAVLGMDNGKKVSTSKGILERCDNPIANLIINWRKLNATYTKMVCPLLGLAETHSRIHGNCLTNTVTGRVSMHEPNLQNVPRDFSTADNSFVISVRMAFVPALGNFLLSADYCQLELRILAHFSKEPTLCAVLREPGDVFKNIAARWYNTLESEIDDTMRQRTKQLCYGMIYGMGVKTLAETLQVEELEAREFLETFMSTYPGIRMWLNQVTTRAREKGFITTLMKRRRMLPGLNSEVPSQKAQAERQAVNSKIQGSAADIAKKAMVLVDERMRRKFPDMPMVLPDVLFKRKLRRSRESTPRGAHLVLQLHDELLYEINASDLSEAARIIKESMEQAYPLSVPLPVKVKTGTAWGDLTEYNFNMADVE